MACKHKEVIRMIGTKQEYYCRAKEKKYQTMIVEVAHCI